MVFSSMIFLWVFLPTVLVVYHLIPQSHIKARNNWLLIMSILFYAWGEPRYVFLMLFSILINYFAGRLLSPETDSSKRNKAVVLVCVLINLGLLGYFKYFSTVLDIISRLGVGQIEFIEIVLPLGISFYTFQAMSYVIDVYRGVCAPQKNLLTLALYVCLFPQLIAGPIVKYKEIEIQLLQRQCTLDDFAYGIKRFIWGLAKKVLIANQLALVVDRVYALAPSELSTSLAWAGALCYMMQIYFDFSGYSDMAIGLGRMLGFKFPENFNLPYISTSIREFWRRWHISLSTWFRDYVYIPLGGNRKGNARTYFNLIIVFLCTGVWHGAGLAFPLWGLYHGFFMIIERMGFGKKLQTGKGRILGHCYVVLVVLIGWVVFRAASVSLALTYYHAMFIPTAISTVGFFEVVDPRSIVTLVAAILLCGPVQLIMSSFTKKEAGDFFSEKSLVQDNTVSACEEEACDEGVKTKASSRGEVGVFLLLILLFACCCIELIAGSYNPFIYFRF